MVQTMGAGNYSGEKLASLCSLFFWSEKSGDYASLGRSMPMGPKVDCDDGKSNLEWDLKGMEEETTCFTGVGSQLPTKNQNNFRQKREGTSHKTNQWCCGRKQMETNFMIKRSKKRPTCCARITICSSQVCRIPPSDYSPLHKCMGTSIGKVGCAEHYNHPQTTVKQHGEVQYLLMDHTDLYGQALACTGGL